eukprot:Nk52_evm27s272 gene=Nk52_evmTU27s272
MTELIGSKVLLITANLGSLFEQFEALLPLWTSQIVHQISITKPAFVAIHFQEVGGKSYKDGIALVDAFYNHIISEPALAAFTEGGVKGLWDDKPDPQSFTALGALFMIHCSLRERVDVYNFVTHSFVPVVGGNRNDSQRGKQQIVNEYQSAFCRSEIFPASLCPRMKLSRKGYLLTRWRFREQSTGENKVISLVNSHLFHDASNIKSSQGWPSDYARFRINALEYTMRKCYSPAYPQLFLFGDVNFRLDMHRFVSAFCADMKPVYTSKMEMVGPHNSKKSNDGGNKKQVGEVEGEMGLRIDNDDIAMVQYVVRERKTAGNKKGNGSAASEINTAPRLNHRQNNENSGDGGNGSTTRMVTRSKLRNAVTGFDAGGPGTAVVGVGSKEVPVGGKATDEKVPMEMLDNKHRVGVKEGEVFLTLKNKHFEVGVDDFFSSKLSYKRILDFDRELSLFNCNVASIGCTKCDNGEESNGCEVLKLSNTRQKNLNLPAAAATVASSSGDLSSSESSMASPSSRIESREPYYGLYEYPINFYPTYPFAEHSEKGTEYDKTRCPAYCDRILLTRGSVRLLNNAFQRAIDLGLCEKGPGHKKSSETTLYMNKTAGSADAEEAVKEGGVIRAKANANTVRGKKNLSHSDAFPHQLHNHHHHNFHHHHHHHHHHLHHSTSANGTKPSPKSHCNSSTNHMNSSTNCSGDCAVTCSCCTGTCECGETSLEYDSAMIRYDSIGKGICMGDHKPVYLSFYI